MADGKAAAHQELNRRLADRGIAPPSRRRLVRDLFNEFLEDVCRRVARGERRPRPTVSVQK